MVKLTYPELKEIINKRQNLARMESKNMITEEEFKTRDKPLCDRYWEIIRKQIKLDRNKKEIIQDKKEENVKSVNYIKDQQYNKVHILSEEKIKMGKETKVESKVKEKKVSNAQLILKALQMKSVKDYDAVAAKVVEEKPEVDVKKVKAMAKVMVREIVGGKGGKSKKYKWDADNFLLTLVE